MLGLPVAETGFVNTPPLPFLVYFEQQIKRGGDHHNCILERNLTIELYTAAADRDTEARVEWMLDALPVEYEKERYWIESERFYQTEYDFRIIEKQEG